MKGTDMSKWLDRKVHQRDHPQTPTQPPKLRQKRGRKLTPGIPTTETNVRLLNCLLDEWEAKEYGMKRTA